MANLKCEATDKLFNVMMSFETLDQYYEFFEDLCTIKEIKEMTQRLEIAKLLNQKISYLEISKMTGASTTTISRINRCLTYGSGGYEAAIKAMEE